MNRQEALARINRHFGLTVLCNLHSLDLARGYCDRLLLLDSGARVWTDPAAWFWGIHRWADCSARHC
jgi:ABC-type phosphate/phosphonate transport system ATPase subunit